MSETGENNGYIASKKRGVFISNILAGAIFSHPPIIVDEVGGEGSNEAKATKIACAEIGQRISSLSPDTIVMISPHGPSFRDAIAVNGSEIPAGSFYYFLLLILI